MAVVTGRFRVLTKAEEEAPRSDSAAGPDDTEREGASTGVCGLIVNTEMEGVAGKEGGAPGPTLPVAVRLIETSGAVGRLTTLVNAEAVEAASVAPVAVFVSADDEEDDDDAAITAGVVTDANAEADADAATAAAAAAPVMLLTVTAGSFIARLQLPQVIVSSGGGYGYDSRVLHPTHRRKRVV